MTFKEIFYPETPRSAISGCAGNYGVKE